MVNGIMAEETEIENPKDPKKKVKEEGYKAMPFKDYVEHTSTIEGGDADFKKMFPEEKMADLEKRDDEFGKKYGEYAKNRSWYGDVYNKQVGDNQGKVSDIVTATAKDRGIDPKMLMGSFLEEGGYKLTYGAKGGYPASMLGLEDFGKDYEKLKKYLPEGFKAKGEMQTDGKRSVPVFKDPKDMTMALAGYLNYYKDEVGKAAKAKGIKLSPESESFFTQAAYNSSKNMDIGNTKKMMDYYKSKGLLKNDKFLTEDSLGKDKYGAIYENTRRRMDSINGLEKDINDKAEKAATTKEWTKEVNGTMTQAKSGQVFHMPENSDYNILILPNGEKKVLPKTDHPDEVDIKTLKNLDEAKAENNKVDPTFPKGMHLASNKDGTFNVESDNNHVIGKPVKMEGYNKLSHAEKVKFIRNIAPLDDYTAYTGEN